MTGVVQTAARATLTADGRRPLVIAHRGHWGPAPENSLAAIAAAEGVADIVEIDVRLLSDGTPYLIHDDTLERTTGQPHAADGLSPDLRAEARLRAGGGGPEAEETDAVLPTLEEALAAAGPDIIFDLDVKRPRDIPAVAALMARHPMRDRATLKVDIRRPSDIECLLDLEARSGVTVMAKLLVHGADELELLAKATEAEVATAEIWFSDLATLRAAAEVGPTLTTYTLDDVHCVDLNDTRARAEPEAVWGTLLDHGIRGIMTDLPDALADLRDARAADRAAAP